MKGTGGRLPHRAVDTDQIVKDCHASVVAARAKLERAQTVLKRASLQVEQDDRVLRSLRGSRRNPRY